MLTWSWTSPRSLRTSPLNPSKCSSSSSSRLFTSGASTETRSLLLVARRNGVGMYTCTLIVETPRLLDSWWSERHAQVALPSIAQDRDDDPVARHGRRHLARGPDIGSGRDAHQQAFLARESARRRRRVLIAHLDDLVQDGPGQHAGHEGGADALNAVRPRPAAREHR